ncbi:hypothetical protein N2152v2_002478 [Parachlorella kessleri]
MKPTQVSMLDMPRPVLAHILSFLSSAEEQPHEPFCSKDLANALLASKRLWQAADALPGPPELNLTAAKQRQAREAGVEDKLLAFLARRGRSWPRVSLDVLSVVQLGQVLGSLKSSSCGSAVAALELDYALADSFGLPEELSALTTLTALSVDYFKFDKSLPAPELARLCSLTALQSVRVTAQLGTGPLPAEAFCLLRHLTSLWLDFHMQRSATELQLSAHHLSGCTALQRLYLENVVLSTSEEAATAAWQQLEELVIHPARGGPDAGLWRALPRLPCLTRVDIQNVSGAPSVELSTVLGESSSLANIWLADYSEALPPQLPTSLTVLAIQGAPELRIMPVHTGLRCLWLSACPSLGAWPDSITTMTQLTCLSLNWCGLQQLPAPLAALPALEVLNLGFNRLTDLPPLACFSSLKRLDLQSNALEMMPEVLRGEAASHIELNLRSNPGGF